MDCNINNLTPPITKPLQGSQSQTIDTQTPQSNTISKIWNEVCWTIGYSNTQFEQNLQHWINTSDKYSRYEYEKMAEIIREIHVNKKEYGFLDGIHLVNLPDQIGTLSTLTSLSCCANHFPIFPKVIGKLVNLTELNYSYNQAKELSEEIGLLLNLQKLILDHNLLVTLPESIGALTNLVYLDVSLNRLQSLPDSIGNLKHLKNLKLSWNSLQSLPDSIGNLINLDSLDLQYNKFESFPVAIIKCKKLKNLSLECNPVKKLPDSIGELINLQVLNLNSTSLSNLPNSIGSLQNLGVLWLFGNYFSDLPEPISKLIKLTFLHLQHCHIQNVPESIGALKNLEYLNLTDNENLNSIPLTLGNCSKLLIPVFLYEKTLRNQMEAIEERIKKISILGTLNLDIRLSSWKKYGDVYEDIDFLSDDLNFDIDQQTIISDWLMQLENYKDFKNKRKNFVTHVFRILKTLNPGHLRFTSKYKEEALSKLKSYLAHDDAITVFNKMYIDSFLHTSINTQVDSDRVKDLIGIAKTLTLRETLSKEVKNEEVILYYESQLKERCKLVTTTNSIQYKGLGQLYNIDVNELIIAVEENYHLAFSELIFEDFPEYMKPEDILNEKLKVKRTPRKKLQENRINILPAILKQRVHHKS